MAKSYVLTPARRAALRKAQLASAAKRRGRRSTPVRPTVGRAYRAGLSLGLSEKRNIRAGLHKSNAAKYQNHKPIKRALAYTAGVYTTSFGVGALVSATNVVRKTSTARKVKYHIKTSPRYAKSYAKGFAGGVKSGYQARQAADRHMRNFGGTKVTRAHGPQMGSMKALPRGTGRNAYSGRRGKRVRGY